MGQNVGQTQHKFNELHHIFVNNLLNNKINPNVLKTNKNGKGEITNERY